MKFYSQWFIRRYRTNDNHPQEDLSKSSYKLNLKQKVLIIFLNFKVFIGRKHNNQGNKFSSFWILGIWEPPKKFILAKLCQRKKC
jgi:hypothetical protein